MLTHEELDRDPWSTYPVSKDELRELIDLRDYVNRYDDKDDHHFQIHSVDENADGSADIELTVGREAARLFIKEGLLAMLKRAVNES